jgi:hypothetical protein
VTEQPRPERGPGTPWWVHLMIGILGLSASSLYLARGLLGEGGMRSLIIGGIWALFGLLWILSAAVARSR